MFQAVLDSVPLFWVENQHLLQQAVSVRIGLGEDFLHGLLVSLWQLADVLSSQVIADKAHVVAIWRAQDSNRALNLIEIVIAREKWRAAQQLCKDAAKGPDIESIGIVTGIEDDLGGAIPSCDHVFSERCGGLFIASGKTEVTDLECAVFVEKEI